MRAEAANLACEVNNVKEEQNTSNADRDDLGSRLDVASSELKSNAAEVKELNARGSCKSHTTTHSHRIRT
jgi:hypothetical protein